MNSESAPPDQRPGLRPGQPIGFDARVSDDGRTTLGPEAATLRADLDRHFAGWGAEVGAHAMVYPAVLSVEDLLALDYFTNFPHLASVVSGLRTDAVGAHLAAGEPLSGRSIGTFATAGGQVLPSAACYSAYLDLAGQNLSNTTTITTVATCFRREEHYDGLRRLFAFTMREIVCVGPREDVLEILNGLKKRVGAFGAELGLSLQVAAATDPFFDPAGARSFMQKLFPVKEEFVYGDNLAIASVNFHRNFFGERCDIRLADDTPAFTGCVAFGLERWLAALGEQFDHDLDRTRKALAANSHWRG